MIGRPWGKKLNIFPGQQWPKFLENIEQINVAQCYKYALFPIITVILKFVRQGYMV